MSLRNRLNCIVNFLCDNAKFVSGFFTLLVGIFQIKFIENYFSTYTFLSFGNCYYWLLFIFILLSLIFVYIEQQEIKALKKKNLDDLSQISTLKEEKTSLSSQISQLETSSEMIYNSYSELFKSFLTLMFNSLDLNHEDRISVYKVTSNQEEECFELIGRVSDNPLLEKPGRKSYPITQGFISEGWKKGEFVVEELPEYSNFDEYYEKILTFAQIERDVIEQINMKSRNYFIFRLKIDGKPIGILVFESLEPNKLKIENIKSRITEIESQLKDFVHKRISKDIFNSSVTAVESGF